MNKLVELVERAYMKKKVPFFKVGDTVKVQTKIVEGGKERVQAYNGIVVGRKGRGMSESFKVSRVAFGYANEKVFSLHSPTVVNIEVVQRGDVRKAKLTYITGKIGKKAKVSSKIGGKFSELYAGLEDETAPEVTEETASE